MFVILGLVCFLFDYKFVFVLFVFVLFVFVLFVFVLFVSLNPLLLIGRLPSLLVDGKMWGAALEMFLNYLLLTRSPVSFAHRGRNTTFCFGRSCILELLPTLYLLGLQSSEQNFSKSQKL